MKNKFRIIINELKNNLNDNDLIEFYKIDNHEKDNT